MAQSGPKPCRAKCKKTAEKSKHKEQRLKFVTYVLQHISADLAVKAARHAGISCERMARKRVMQHIQQHESFGDGERRTQARVFTEEVLDKALGVLMEEDQKLLTASKLLGELQQRGVLSSSSHDTRHFIACLRKHAEVQGWHVQANCTATETFLAPADPKARVVYCKTLLDSFEEGSQSVKTLVFLDETSILEFEHPKGERTVSLLLLNPYKRRYKAQGAQLCTNCCALDRVRCLHTCCALAPELPKPLPAMAVCSVPCQEGSSPLESHWEDQASYGAGICQHGQEQPQGSQLQGSSFLAVGCSKLCPHRVKLLRAWYADKDLLQAQRRCSHKPQCTRAV